MRLSFQYPRCLPDVWIDARKEFFSQRIYHYQSDDRRTLRTSGMQAEYQAYDHVYSAYFSFFLYFSPNYTFAEVL